MSIRVNWYSLIMAKSAVSSWSELFFSHINQYIQYLPPTLPSSTPFITLLSHQSLSIFLLSFSSCSTATAIDMLSSSFTLSAAHVAPHTKAPTNISNSVSLQLFGTAISAGHHHMVYQVLNINEIRTPK